MSKRITITCPACSATLAAPVSAVGKTLLCPKCQTGIPVQKPVKRTPASMDKPAGDAHIGKHQVTDGKVTTVGAGEGVTHQHGTEPGAVKPAKRTI